MREALFIGGILASVTHDMQNVMAIIKESGALADDILTINGPPRLRHGDKLTTALVNIQEQVKRGRDLMLMLNGFAHAATDFPECGDLVRFTRQIATLDQRMARLKECSLVTDLDVPPVLVLGNALTIMQSVHVGLSAMLDICQANDVIRIGIVPAGEDGRISLRISAENSKKQPDIQTMAPLMTELGGECRSGEGVVELRYSLAPAQGTAKP